MTYDDINKAGFSRQKLQIGTFDGSDILKQYPRNRLGNVGEISLRNNSTIYITTDHGQYHHVEGKSASHIMLDEAQYQDMQYFDRVPLVMTITQGKIYAFFQKLTASNVWILTISLISIYKL